MAASPKLPPFDPAAPLGIDDLLDPEDLAVRDTVRDWTADRRGPAARGPAGGVSGAEDRATGPNPA
ncbi:hypothetical protein GCM10010377_50710 [Streptomyces viridiviolaceus]|nr:hypothetical protein GCM10010377_50710 [Streptomyces viridiviolaceus]